MYLVHTDTMEPIAPVSYKFGNRYIVTFIDDASGYAWAYPMGDKTQVHLAFEKMLENLRTIRGRETKIFKLRLDNGTEYMTDELKKILARENINKDDEKLPPHTPNLGGCAERFNLELQEKMRSLLFDSGFPLQMWAYAQQFAGSVYNKTPHKSIR